MKKFKIKDLSVYRIIYKDEDGDNINIVNDDDYQLAVRQQQILTLYIVFKNKNQKQLFDIQQGSKINKMFEIYYRELMKNFYKDHKELTENQKIPCQKCFFTNKNSDQNIECKRCNNKKFTDIDQSWNHILFNIDFQIKSATGKSQVNREELSTNKQILKHHSEDHQYQHMHSQHSNQHDSIQKTVKMQLTGVKAFKKKEQKKRPKQLNFLYYLSSF